MKQIDYTIFPNPYEARYGRNWEDIVKKSYFLAKYTPVTDLIDHIVEQTKVAGKTHFYHDALSLMCAKESIAYMEEKGVLEVVCLVMNMKIMSSRIGATHQLEIYFNSCHLTIL